MPYLYTLKSVKITELLYSLLTKLHTSGIITDMGNIARSLSSTARSLVDNPTQQATVGGVALPPGVSRAILYQALVAAHPGRTKRWCARQAGYAPTTSTTAIEQTLDGVASKMTDDELRVSLARHPLYSKVGILSRLAGIATATTTHTEVDPDTGRRHRTTEYTEPAPVRIQAEREIIKVAGHEAPKQIAARMESKSMALFADLADLTPAQIEALCT